MQTHVKKTFRDQEIVADANNAYINCKLIKCHIIYMGGDFSFLNCQFEDCQVTITGEAGKTLAFMQMIGMLPPGGAPPVPPAMAQQAEGAGAH